MGITHFVLAVLITSPWSMLCILYAANGLNVRPQRYVTLSMERLLLHIRTIRYFTVLNCPRCPSARSANWCKMFTKSGLWISTSLEWWLYFDNFYELYFLFSSSMFMVFHLVKHVDVGLMETKIVALVKRQIRGVWRRLITFILYGDWKGEHCDNSLVLRRGEWGIGWNKDNVIK